MSVIEDVLAKQAKQIERLEADLARVAAENEKLKECEDRVGELLKSLREMETCRDEAKSMLEFLSTGVDWKRSGLDQYAIDLIPVAIQRSKTMEEREASQATGGGDR